MAAFSWRTALDPPCSQLVVGRRPRGEVRRVRRRRGERRVEAGDQQAQVLRDARERLEVGGDRRRDGGRQALGRVLVRVAGVGDVRLEHRDGRRAVLPRDDLRPAGQPRHAAERRLLGQVGRHLEIRVEARLDPPVRLEQQPLAEHDRRVRLVAAEGPLGGSGQGARGRRPTGRQARVRAGRRARRPGTRTRPRAASPRSSVQPRSQRPAPATCRPPRPPRGRRHPRP